MSREFSGDGSIDSSCGKYRYVTWTTLAGGTKGTMTVIALSPLFAGGASDQAFQACRSLAEDLGYGKLLIVSLFALHKAEDGDVRALLDPVGPDNDKWTAEAAAQADTVVVAWGDFARIGARANAVMTALKEIDLYSIQNNRSGSPAHPLAWRLKVPKIYRRGMPASYPVAG